MEQRKKIVIPVGDASREAGAARSFDGGATVPAPLFDEEATMGARPVVPLAEASNRRPSYLPLLALVVIVAVSAGVAGGFLIGLYKSRQNQQSAATPTATTTVSTEQTAQTPAQEQLPATIASDKSSAPATPPPARDNGSKRDKDEAVLAPVEVRERDREKRDREDKIARETNAEEREVKKQRKERRRRAREAEEADADINRQVERGARELNRIREIFEGQRP